MRIRHAIGCGFLLASALVAFNLDAEADAPKPWASTVISGRVIFDFFPKHIEVQREASFGGNMYISDVQLLGSPNVDPTVAPWLARSNVTLRLFDQDMAKLTHMAEKCADMATTLATLPATSNRRLRITIEQKNMKLDHAATTYLFHLRDIFKLTCRLM